MENQSFHIAIFIWMNLMTNLGRHMWMQWNSMNNQRLFCALRVFCRWRYFICILLSVILCTFFTEWKPLSLPHSISTTKNLKYLFWCNESLRSMFVLSFQVFTFRIYLLKKPFHFINYPPCTHHDCLFLSAKNI